MKLNALNEEMLMARAAGTLSEPFRLLVDTHAAIQGGWDTDLADITGGALLEEEPPADLPDTALETVLAAIDDLENAQGGEAEESRKAAKRAVKNIEELLALPDPIRVKALERGGKWQFMAPGIRRMVLAEENGVKAELLRIKAGKGAPLHTHEGREFTIVLSGAFADETGEYRKGDLSVVGPETTHRPVAIDGDEVCLTLAITEGRLKFKGMMGVAQRLTGL